MARQLSGSQLVPKPEGVEPNMAELPPTARRRSTNATSFDQCARACSSVGHRRFFKDPQKIKIRGSFRDPLSQLTSASPKQSKSSSMTLQHDARTHALCIPNAARPPSHHEPPPDTMQRAHADPRTEAQGLQELAAEERAAATQAGGRRAHRCADQSAHRPARKMCGLRGCTSRTKKAVLRTLRCLRVGGRLWAGVTAITPIRTGAWPSGQSADADAANETQPKIKFWGECSSRCVSVIRSRNPCCSFMRLSNPIG